MCPAQLQELLLGFSCTLTNSSILGLFTQGHKRVHGTAASSRELLLGCFPLGNCHHLSSSLLVMLNQNPEHFVNYKVVILSFAAELPRLNWFSQTDKIEGRKHFSAERKGKRGLSWRRWCNAGILMPYIMYSIYSTSLMVCHRPIVSSRAPWGKQSLPFRSTFLLCKLVSFAASLYPNM